MDPVRVEGIDETLRTLNEIAKDYPKQTVAAGLRSAAKPFVTAVKRSGPDPSFAKLAGVKVYTKSKDPLIAVGQFGGRKKKIWKTTGSYMSMWFISYWLNYGTLSKRLAGHAFGNARKAKSARWRGGIDPTRSVEKAWEQSKGSVISAIPAELRKATAKYIDKLKRKNAR